MDIPDKEVKKSGQGLADRHDQEIRYEPLPGYRPVFFLLLAVAGAYLAYVFQAGAHG